MSLLGSLFMWRNVNCKRALPPSSTFVCLCNLVEEVKAKWKNLRDTYTRKKRLEQDGNRSGRAAKKNKQWKYMRVMDFLDTSIEHGRYSSVFNLILSI